jgi:hypothetical protein
MGHLHAHRVFATAHHVSRLVLQSMNCIQIIIRYLILGFYDTDLEWVGLENIQIVSSMNPSTTLGRHELNTRFSSVVRVMYMDYTDREQLQVSRLR